MEPLPAPKAAEPRTDFDDSDRIGWAWFTTKDRSPNLTWHNGGTGGYRSFLGFSAETGHGVIVAQRFGERCRRRRLAHLRPGGG
jgi:hypothetical protein